MKLKPFKIVFEDGSVSIQCTENVKSAIIIAEELNEMDNKELRLFEISEDLNNFTHAEIHMAINNILEFWNESKLSNYISNVINKLDEELDSFNKYTMVRILLDCINQ